MDVSKATSSLPKSILTIITEYNKKFIPTVTDLRKNKIK